MVSSDTKAALLTGATGYLGGHLCRALQRNGWRVTALVRAETLNRGGFASLGSAELTPYDGKASSVNLAVEKATPRIVFHLASVTPAHTGPDQVEPMIEANILFGTQLLEAMRRTECTRFVNTGTFSQHYQGASYNPANLYAATKQAFEAIIEYYRQADHLSCITLNLCDTYGPNDPRPKILTYLLRQLKSDEPLAMSPGEQKMDLIHVDDVCSAYLRAAQLLSDNYPALEPVYYVASGRLLILRQIVSLFEQLAGRPLNIHWGGRPYRPREVMTPWTGGRLPGWKPQVSLEAGLKQLIDAERNSIL